MMTNVQHHSQNFTEVQQNFISKFHHRKKHRNATSKVSTDLGGGGGGGGGKRCCNLELVCIVHFAEYKAYNQQVHCVFNTSLHLKTPTCFDASMYHQHQGVLLLCQVTCQLKCSPLVLTLKVVKAYRYKAVNIQSKLHIEGFSSWSDGMNILWFEVRFHI